MMTKKLSLSHKTVGKTTMVTTEKNLNILIWISICSFQHLKYFFSGPIANLSGSLFCADEGKTNNTWRGGNNLLWWPTSVFHLITMITKYDAESYTLFLFICLIYRCITCIWSFCAGQDGDLSAQRVGECERGNVEQCTDCCMYPVLWKYTLTQKWGWKVETDWVALKFLFIVLIRGLEGSTAHASCWHFLCCSDTIFWGVLWHWEESLFEILTRQPVHHKLLQY